MEAKSLKTVLARHDFLKSLKEPHLDILTGCAANARFSAGQVIFQAGDLADHFYLVRQGRVALQIPVSTRKALTVQTLGDNDFLGWSWLIPPYKCHLTALALEPVAAFSFDGKCIRGKFERDPELGYEFYKRFSLLISNRLEQTLLQLIGISDRAA